MDKVAQATQGRLVIYTDHFGDKYGAHVNQVDANNVCELTVFSSVSPTVLTDVQQGTFNHSWDWMEYQKGQAQKTEQLEEQLAAKNQKIVQKDMGITEVRGAKANISDLVVYGDGDTFALLCKASSQAQGWMKSTKVCNVRGGCLIQVTTQQRNPDGSYAVAEALTFVPNMNINVKADPRVLEYVGPAGGL